MGERTRELTVLIIGDVLVFIVALWLTLLIRYVSIPSWELFAEHLGPFLILSTVWLLIFYIAGLYDKQTVFLKSQLFNRIFNAQVINAIAASFLFLVIPFGIAPKTNLVIYLLLSVVLMTWWRASLYNKIEPKTRHRAILLADGPEAIELVDETNNNDRYNYTFVRLIDKKTATNTENFQSKLLTLIEKENIDIVVANPDLEYVNEALPKIFDLSFLRFRTTFLDFYKVYENTFDRVPVDSIQYDWFLSNISQSNNAIYNFIKRTIDILGAFALMIPSALLFPVVAALIKLEDKGPLFYSTSRVGQFNKLITIYKFRTKNGADSGAAALNSVLVDTKIGRILRKTRIDELPQLLNVLKGDLSFIGPRPEMPSLVDVYVGSVPYYNARHFLKPGLSGWAQINNFDVPRGGIDIERTKVKVSYDLYYLEHHSLLLDTQIALKTIATIIMRTGS
jgi:lipopolysaccharide/colanic/teichoic acid biosynthesis glycosyltransferase